MKMERNGAQAKEYRRPLEAEKVKEMNSYRPFRKNPVLRKP